MNRFFECSTIISANLTAVRKFTGKRIPLIGEVKHCKKIKALNESEAISIFKRDFNEIRFNIGNKVNLKNLSDYNMITIDLIQNVYKEMFVNEKVPVIIKNVTFGKIKVRELSHKEACKYFTTQEILDFSIDKSVLV